MKPKIYSVFLGLLIISPFSAFAGLSAYSGTAGEKVFIESGDKESAFMKIDGVKSPWAGKVIKVEKVTAGSSYRYSFDYTIELSTGKIKRTYTPIVADGETLVKGSVVPKIRLYYTGVTKDGIKLNWDETLTNSSQSMNLAAQYKKAPFTPEIDP